MQCEEVRDQFTDYLNDSLVDPARSEMQQHLISCASCRNEAEALNGIWKRLDSIPAESPDSGAMRERFHVMLEAYRQGLDHAPRPGLWDRVNAWMGTWWPQQPAVQFGLAVVLLAAGLFIGQQRSAEPIVPNPEIGEMRSELRGMRQLVALSLMQQQSATDRLQGVSWSNQIEQPGSEILTALLDTLMRDSNVNVRLAAVDALRKFGERNEVRSGIVEALGKETPPMVQMALIDLAVELEEKGSVETLRRITQDATQNTAVRERAGLALEALK